MKLFIVIPACLLLVLSIGQVKACNADSLIQKLDGAGESEKVELFHAIGNTYFDCYSLDTALIWFEKMEKQAGEMDDQEMLDLAVYSIASIFMYQNKYEKSIDYFLRSVAINQEMNNDTNIAADLNNIGVVYHTWGKLDLAIEYYEKAAEIYKRIDRLEYSASCFNNIGAIYDSWGRYEKALNEYNKGLEISKKINDSSSVATAINNIGNLYYAWGKYEEALSYFEDSLAITGENGDIATRAVCYNNLGTIYTHLKDYDKALDYLNKTRQIDIELKREDKLAVVLSNIGNIYKAKEEYNKAIEYYKQALVLDEKLGREDKVAIRLANLGSIYGKQNKLNLALEAYRESMEINKRLNLAPQLAVNYKSLYSIYKSNSDFKKALYYHELLNELNDSLFTKESYDKLSELRTIYETEKKQQQLELEITKNEKHQEQLEKKRIQNILYILALSFMGLIVFLGLLSYRKIRKSNKLIEEKNVNLEHANQEINEQKKQIEDKNEELHQQNEEISAQRDEIEKQRDTLQIQKNQIEVIHKEMTSSIRYAERIQRAMLVIDDVLRNSVSDHFIYFKPRDIVSGDFYFMSGIKDCTVIAIADCTGHGVPGAFMSMMGTAFLSEIVNKQNILESNQILEELRNKIVKALHQDDHIQENEEERKQSVKDGMDISLVVINNNTGRCQYSGANLPLYIIRKNSTEDNYNTDLSLDGFDLIELKPDRMPIAIYEKMEAFGKTDFELRKGDIIYLFSDGFADQFGGATSHGEKFKYKPFKKLLLKLADKPMDQQRSTLDKVYLHWTNNVETENAGQDKEILSIISSSRNRVETNVSNRFDQVDDICIVGIKI